MRIPPEAKDMVRLRSYQSLLAPAAWVRKSNELFDAARLLEPSVLAVWTERMKPEASRADFQASGVISIHLLLAAYGIENLLKAVLVKRHGTVFAAEVETSKKLPEVIRKASHDLVDLASQVYFKPTPDEEWLLRRLTRAARWSGRYPAPTNVAGLVSSERFSSGRYAPVALNWPRDVELLARLRERITNAGSLTL